MATYHGDKEQRQEQQDSLAASSFDVLLTTPDVVLKDVAFLSRWKYPVLVVDEAHRLKNSSSRYARAPAHVGPQGLHECYHEAHHRSTVDPMCVAFFLSLYVALLQDLTCGFSLLLTGTPVQNNLTELYALLHFVHPAAFPLAKAERFVEHFAEVRTRTRHNRHDIRGARVFLVYFFFFFSLSLSFFPFPSF